MNDADEDFDAIVLREAMRADLLIVCLSAVQTLSETERILIQKRLIPVTAAELTLAVSHMDRLETPEDSPEIQRRIGRFIERSAPRTMRPAAYGR